MFVGTVWPPEHAYLAHLLRRLGHEHYPRVVEPCAGSFAISLVARAAGWAPDQIEASDVSLFSAVIGMAAGGQDLNALQVRVEGERLDLPRDVHEAAPLVLMELVLARVRAEYDRRASAYLGDVLDDLERRRDHYQVAIARQVSELTARLGPIRYRGLDLSAHVDQVASDPGAIVMLAPPMYAKGYERFYDTGGRIEWDQPPYAPFDPSSIPSMMEDLGDAAALAGGPARPG